MKRRQILSGVMLAGLSLALAAGLCLAQGNGPPREVALQGSLGSAFTYQGELKKDGSPLNGACDLRFVLYNAGTGGAQVGPLQEKRGVNVTDGRFTIPDLDFGREAFNGEARWLEISVRFPAGSGSYTLLSPRQAITAVPYALYAIGGGGAGAWRLSGNAGTTADNFLGTTDSMTMTLAVSSTAALRLVPHASSPNFIGGSGANRVAAGVWGATISGGGNASEPNQVTDSYGALGGGAGNVAGNNDAESNNAPYATVSGGRGNIAAGYLATVGGGDYNNASGANAVIGGGRGNIASGYLATIGGGDYNVASEPNATVGGGEYNMASGWYAAIGGGDSNTASGGYAAIGGGSSNTVSGHGTYVGGGTGNSASGLYATIGGGEHNTASGAHATVSGGYRNTADGSHSFAAGNQAQANHEGAFVWSSAEGTASWGNNTFTVRAHGGARFYTAAGTSTGVQLSAGGNSWLSISDRNAKENLADVDGTRLLETLAALPISTWNLKSQASTTRHIGPLAQDFNPMFAYLLGEAESSAHINTMDAVGVSLAAAQELYQRVKEQATCIVQLEAENAALKAEDAAQQQAIADLQKRMSALEAQASRAATLPQSRAVNLLTGHGSVLGLLLAGLVVGLLVTRQGGGQ